VTEIVLGRYRLEQQVGQGGMAVVWRGFDTQLRRVVAVKVLHAHLHTREEVRRRFDREAHAVARLHHPHILDVYDFSGPDAEPSYLVTEFIRGSTLRVFAEAHPFDPPELAAACLLPIAEALEHAHASGVVHRDLKPENVMVREDGLIKLTDFGIAALLDPDEKMTVTGSILGSPSHLAPETIEGKPTDPRSDLFSFGTILYWLACGQLPFRAPSPAALLRQILEGTLVDPRMVRKGVSDDLARIIARCLERDPQKRYQSARELKEELAALVAEAGIEDPRAEVAAFVKAQPPETHALLLRGRVVARALSRGEGFLAQGRTAAALAEFGHALALDPGNAPAQGRVDRIRRRARAVALARGAVAVSFVVSILGVGGVRGARALQTWRAERAAQADRAADAPDAGPAPVAQAAGPTTPPGAAAQDAGVAARDLGDDPQQIPRHTSGRQRPPREGGIGVVPARPQQLAAGAIPVTLRVHYFWGNVTLDGALLGESESFKRPLAPGRHVAVVRHPCCADNTQVVEVVPNIEHYILEHGAAKDAFLHVKNAPPDARVLVDGGFLSTVADLASRPIAVGDKPMREATVTVGDRAGHVTLLGGRTQEVDFLNLPKQDGAP
jgi:serine/threonine-protein kinase